MGLFDIFKKKKKTSTYQITVNGRVYECEFDCSKEAIERYEENRNSEKNTPVRHGYERVDIDAFLDKYIRGASIPEDLFQELQHRHMAGFTYADIPIEVLREVEENYKTAIERDRIITQTAALNNEGMEAEKAGNIDAAIAAYQQNVSNMVVASCSYERLMIIYRRLKDYDKEIEVIEKAIEVFGKENERRAEIAIKENPSKTSEIKAAMESCTVVRGDTKNQFGAFMVCFAPYNVAKYKNRLEKARSLRAKHSKC